MTELTRSQLQALAVLADGPAKVSNRNGYAAVAWQTLQALEAAGLAIDVAGHRAILTDRGRQVADDPPDPPARQYDHGTHACYVLDQCRCDRCRQANSEYEARRTKDNAYGRPRLVDAEPVRQHVKQLMASRVGSNDGVGLKRIAQVSGVSHGALWKLIYGDPRRDGRSKVVRADTADALLAVTQADRADGSRVPADPTVDRLTDLRDAGATWAELSDGIGGSGAGNTCGIVHRDSVTVATARAVHRLWTRWQEGDWTPRGRRPGGHWKAKLERDADG